MIGKKPRRQCDPETGAVGDTMPRRVTGRPCATCTSPKRLEIEKAIVDGVPFERIEREITNGHPCDTAMKRHAQVCVPEMMQLRRANVAEADEVSMEMLRLRAKKALDRSGESMDLAFEEDEEGKREGAQGRSVAIKTELETIKATGEIYGLIQNQTKVQVILSDPAVSEMVHRLIALVPDDKIEEAEAIVAEYMS